MTYVEPFGTFRPEPDAMVNQKGTSNEATGVVTEALPNTLFRVELQDGRLVLAYLGGKMRLHRIRVLLGDKVIVLLDSYGGKARITKRLT